MTGPIRIGKQHQLFLDGYLIQWRDKLTRRVCPVRKHPDNPVIRPREGWEPRGYSTYGSVFYDEAEGLYKAWCQGQGRPWKHRKDENHPIRKPIHYFTSEDGLEWHRPNLDLFPVDGQRTNIVALPQASSHPRRWAHCYELFGVSKDPAEPDPARRYRMGYLYLDRDYHGKLESPYHPGQLRALGVAFSPDGVRWTDMDEPITLATSDGATHWFTHPDTGRWILYGRTRHIDRHVQKLHGEERFFQHHHSGRAVRRAESEDFLHWSPEEGQRVLSTDVLDEPSDEIYGMNVFPYEGIYIGLVQMFHNRPDAVWLDVQLAVSRDSIHFERLSDRSPFIPVGETGAWDRFNNSVANNPPLRVGEELRFYYAGRNYRHSGAYEGQDDGAGCATRFTSAVGLGTIKPDRFAALRATFEPGVLLTRPFLFQGTRLHLNAAVPFGRLEVQAMTPEGEPIEGSSASLAGCDSVDAPLKVDGLQELRGRPVRLRFKLQNGDLYAFWMD